jgi:precorrin-6A synthase
MDSRMRTLSVIGIGSGDPEHLTVQAIKAMNRARVFFIVDKGNEKSALVDVRTDICNRFIEHSDYRFVTIDEATRDRRPQDYKAEVGKWHRERADRYADAILENLGEDECGAFLVWGDPCWYDSTIRILQMILETGRVAFDYDVIPGIASFQVLAAKHRVPLNEIGEAVKITTGRKLADGGEGRGAESLVVMLDGQCAFNTVPAAEYEIFWGAYLGMQSEVLRAGPLKDVAHEIARVREEQRVANGWIMDTYLLRRIRDE